MRDETRARRGFAVAAVLSVAAYHLSVFGVLFLLPLQWVRARQGLRPFLLVSVLAAAGIGGVAWTVSALTKAPWSVIDLAALGLPVVLIAGWAAIVSMERLGWRFLYRLLAVTAVTGLVLFPLVASLLAQPAFSRALGQAFDAVWKQALETPGLNLAAVVGESDRTAFFDLLKEAFLGSFLVVFFLFWAGTHRIARLFEPQSGPWTLKDFFVPAQGAWVLLGLWGLILVQGLLLRAGVKWDWGFGLHAGLNVAWIALAVHALAGWGIVESLMDRWRWPRFGQIGARALTVLLLLSPGPGQWVVLAGLPILAVLELWVNFRKRTQGVGL